jgi:O-antigen/teichoic acid export membrane protein
VLGASLLPFFWVSVFGASVVFVLTLVLVRREAPLLPAFDFGEWRSLLRETLPYAAAAALGVVYFRVAVILMSLISTNEQTGYFSVSFRILEIVTGVPWLLVASAFPILARAARDDHDRLRYALQRLFDVSMLASGWMALMMGVGAQFAIAFVGGAGFDEAVPVLQILGAALVGTFLVATWGLALLSLHRHRALLVANAIAIVVGGALTLLLVPDSGAKGGAIATSVTELCLAFSYGVALVRARPDLRPALFVVPRVAAAAALGVLPALLFDLPSIVEAAIATVIYFAFLFIAQAVPDELREALFRGGRSSRSG